MSEIKTTSPIKSLINEVTAEAKAANAQWSWNTSAFPCGDGAVATVTVVYGPHDIGNPTRRALETGVKALIES